MTSNLPKRSLVVSSFCLVNIANCLASVHQTMYFVTIIDDGFSGFLCHAINPLDFTYVNVDTLALDIFSRKISQVSSA